MRARAALASSALVVAWASSAHAAPAWREVPVSGLGLTESYSGFFAWDPAARRARFVGADITDFNGFEAEGSTWTKTAPGGPPRRGGFSAAFDTARGAWVTFGGDYKDVTWELSGTSWTQVDTAGPAGRWSAAMAFDPVRGRAVLFGGTALFGSAPPGVCDALACHDTWEYDGSWHPKSPATTPPARNQAAMFFHPGLKRVVMVGGKGADCLADTWTWSGVDWEKLEGATAPAAGRSAAAAWDESRARAVLVVADVGCKVGGQRRTYELVGSDWVEITVSTPWLYDDFSLAYDPTTGEVFGGTSLSDHLFVYRNQLPLGAACGDALGCESGHCKRGACCASACEGACSTCDEATGAPATGICGVARAGLEVESCGPYRCNGVDAGCPASCVADTDCVGAARCATGRCVPPTTCSEDGLSVREGDERSCAPFRCRSGACLASCATGMDCAPGHVCATDGRCVAPQGDDAGGGCSVGAAATSSAPGVGSILALALLCARRRRSTT
ncbi:MAG: hypothetical protein IT374_28375 [Polyangiaceae bacterium]|nr:hypothetical protein [Polyangiaceae bacterium]